MEVDVRYRKNYVGATAGRSSAISFTGKTFGIGQILKTMSLAPTDFYENCFELEKIFGVFFFLCKKRRSPGRNLFCLETEYGNAAESSGAGVSSFVLREPAGKRRCSEAPDGFSPGSQSASQSFEQVPVQTPWPVLHRTDTASLLIPYVKTGCSPA